MAPSLSDIALDSPPEQVAEQPPIAALDIGSNSFHMVIARYVEGDFQFLEREKHQVQLAAGLDKHNRLSEEAVERSMQCLDRLNTLILKHKPTQIRAVATHTLRIAGNAEAFLQRASQHFPVPIEVISGIQEAKFIYQGVSHLSNIRDRSLVIDIGGGSTEFIIGANFQEKQLRSCPIGCVNLTQEFFTGGKINKQRMVKLVQAVEKKILPFQDKYLRSGWQECLGSSGSIKMVDRILKEEGYRKRTITLEHLLAIGEQILTFDHVKEISLPGLCPERAAILPAAVGILIAAFKTLSIDQMTYSRGALREGLLYSMIRDQKTKTPT